MVVGIFGLAGFFRGWWKEAITTGLLSLLLIMLRQPALASTIIEQVNKMIKFIATLFQAGSLEVNEIASVANTTEPPLTLNAGEFNVYIIVLIGLVLLSYIIGNNAIADGVLTPIARIFGGILGLVNGFIVLSLAREYVLGRFLPGSGVSTASAVPETLTVTIADVPQSSIMDGFTVWVFIGVGLLVAAMAIGSRYDYQSGKLEKKAPLGYKA